MDSIPKFAETMLFLRRVFPTGRISDILYPTFLYQKGEITL